MPKQRKRRSADDSKQRILDAAVSLLTTGGVSAVQIRAVARQVDMTDAGVSHHFGTRDQLLDALLRHGGRRIRSALDQVLDLWLEDEPSIAALVDALTGVYRQGFGDLAVGLHASGFKDYSTGLLEPVVDALHEHLGGRPAEKTQVRLAVAALHQAVALDAVYGSAFRRSAGLVDDAANDPTAQMRWWTRATESQLGLGP